MSSQEKDVEDPITVEEVRQIAKRKLPQNVWDFYACGADEQMAMRRNALAFNRLFVLPRVLTDVARVDTATTIFGTRYPMPVGIAPSAMQRLVGGDGEMDMARAAAKLGLNMTLASQSTTSMEDVIQTRGLEGAQPQFWFQIYLAGDLNKSVPLIKRAEAAGYEALVLTVDTPVLGNRLNERKTPLALPAHLRLANIEPASETRAVRKPTLNRVLMDARTAQEAENIISSGNGSMHSAALTWASTLPFLRSTTCLKVILKGIMTPEDALLAIEHGADAIVVSNHGGRQLDCVASTIEALPDIAAVVAGRIPVFMDGGITRGSDIFKALALGADFVLIGRTALWGLAYDAQHGVEAVGNMLERELSRTMALAGVANIKAIDRAMLGVAKEHGFGVARL